MPNKPSVPLYKVNEKVKIINNNESLCTPNARYHRAKFQRDKHEIGIVQEVITERNTSRKTGITRKEYYYILKVNRPNPLIRKHQCKLKPFNWEDK